ncbi:hypothetical protein SWZG_00005 [Synechococcus phage S-SKS1]|uniref:LamG-like jellyroll fold domain-containing protein n=1 Tax=Synechococcus phage S-SKS1 TaxID=754042 RepID=M4QRQ0_9CAUD|nr:hypothetical protein SWZG_00005 [Synechococcus phage S-SKS1]AGH31518.1 hypothetical protein SWZG_00005 [Synechococcus phage S-SKS1]
MSRYHNPKITTNKNLSLALDAANPKSYTGVTTSVTDISLNNNTATLYNGVGYTSSNVGYFTFNGINHYMEIPYDESVNLTDGDFTIDFWMNSFSDQTSDVLVSYGNTSTVGGWAIKTATNKLQYSVGFVTHPTAAVAGIVTSGLVLHLDAGDTDSYPGSGTTWTDLSGQGNNGTLTNGPTYSSADGGSIVFDGTDDYVTTGNQLDPDADGLFANSTSAWSVTSWFNSDTVGSGQDAITGKGGGLGAAATYVTYRDGNNLKVRLRGGTVTTVSSISANTWYEVTVTWDGSTSKSYLNGVFATNLAVGSASKQTNNFDIGATASGTTNRFDGKISQTLVYNKALTASEIQRNYNALKGRYTSPSPLDPLDIFGIAENADFSSGITTNTWNHYALVRSGNVYTPYVNAVPRNPSYDYSADLNRDLYFDNASIILNANGNDGSTNIIDSSKNNHTGIITAYNGASISTAEYKFGGSSLYFDGTNDYIDCGTDSSYAMEDEDFTIEFWMYTDQSNFAKYVFRTGPQSDHFDNTVPDGSLAVYANTGSGGSGSITFERKRGGSINANGVSITGGQWNHIAWTREGDSYYFFINGTLSYSTTGTDTRSPYNESRLIVGCNYRIDFNNNDSYVDFFNGYIDDFRITKGVAKYTSDFTPPNQASYYSNDPNYDNLSILLQGNGQNLSTSIIDSSSYNHTGIITAYNGAGISTSEYKFGGSSLYFDGTNDYIDCGISSDYSFGNDPFTIEFWMRVNTSFFHTVQRSIFTTTRDYGQFNQFIYGGIELEARIGYGFNDPNIGQPFASFYFTQRDNSGSNGTGFGVPDYVSRGAFFHDNWGHIAISCDGTYHRLFFNGVLAPSLITAYRQPYEGDQIIIGGRNLSGSISNFINAYIDDFRVTKGVAKYTDDFVPPDRTKIKNNQASLKFGASGIGNTNPFNGALSNLKIYKDSLTQSEITQNFNAHKSRYGL